MGIINKILLLNYNLFNYNLCIRNLFRRINNKFCFQVMLLKDVLDTWKKEVEKKPPIMTIDEAYKVLGLQNGKQHNEAIVRKSYYKLAQMYHPDKNPQGRVSSSIFFLFK